MQSVPLIGGIRGDMLLTVREKQYFLVVSVGGGTASCIPLVVELIDVFFLGVRNLDSAEYVVCAFGVLAFLELWAFTKDDRWGRVATILWFTSMFYFVLAGIFLVRNNLMRLMCLCNTWLLLVPIGLVENGCTPRRGWTIESKEVRYTGSDLCPICHEDMDRCTRLECGHEFHTDCVRQWLVYENKNTCPLCMQCVKHKSPLCTWNKNVWIVNSAYVPPQGEPDVVRELSV